jgi:hypothetical protein
MTSVAPPRASGDRCTRCAGTGHVDSPQIHLGIPGLCLDCDGDGRGETQRRNRLARQRAEERVAARAALRRQTEAPVLALRAREGAGRAIPHDRRDAFPVDTIFTTAAYARANGLSNAEAFRELALAHPAVQVAFGEDGRAIGWKRAY